jgi:hypothetical protein
VRLLVRPVTRRWRDLKERLTKKIDEWWREIEGLVGAMLLFVSQPSFPWCVSRGSSRPLVAGSRGVDEGAVTCGLRGKCLGKPSVRALICSWVDIGRRNMKRPLIRGD